jgi:hypothetical protein
VEELHEAGVVADGRDALERVEDGREEEPGQQERRDEVLDVAVEGVERGDREREAGHEADGEQRERQRQPDGVAGLGHVDEAEPDHDHEHHREADELRRHHREREKLAREAHLADEVRVLQHGARGGLQRGREEDPDRQPGEQEEPVVLVLRRLDLQEQREDEQVDEHQDDRVRQRPREPEHGALVLHAQVTAEEAAEELAIADEIGVDRHERALV